MPWRLTYCTDPFGAAIHTRWGIDSAIARKSASVGAGALGPALVNAVMRVSCRGSPSELILNPIHRDYRPNGTRHERSDPEREEPRRIRVNDVVSEAKSSCARVAMGRVRAM